MADAAGTGPADGEITLAATPVNDAPTAAVDSYRAYRDVPLSQAAPGVLGNDRDAEGARLSAVLVRAPAQGSLVLQADGAFVYTPAAGFAGADSFTYRASDGALTSAEAVVSLTVQETRLFSDTFSHGTAKGDPDWACKAGRWYVNALKAFCADPARRDLAVVRKFDPRTNARVAGRLEGRVRLNARAGTLPNLTLVFGYRDPTHFRYLTLGRGKLTLGQLGTIDGTGTGVRKAVGCALGLGKWYPLRLDAYPDGTVKVYVNRVLRLTGKFTRAVAGGIGCAADRADAWVDDFAVWDEHVLR